MPYLFGVMKHLHEVLFVLSALSWSSIPRPAPELVPDLKRYQNFIIVIISYLTWKCSACAAWSSTRPSLPLLFFSSTWVSLLIPVSALTPHHPPVPWAGSSSVTCSPGCARAAPSAGRRAWWCPCWSAWRPSCTRCSGPSGGCQWAVPSSGAPAPVQPSLDGNHKS